MTRDEAHAKLRAETRSLCTEGQMADFLDMAVALGMLKLDEPKSRDEKVQDAMKASLGIMATWQDLHRIDSAMADAGLKIVEK